MNSLPALIAAGCLLLTPCFAADPPPGKKGPGVPPGMKVYFVGLLKKGPKWTTAEDAETAKVLSDHVAYLAKLEKDGRVAVAGSFLGGSTLRGMVIYKVPTMAEARAIVQDDPAIQSSRLIVDLYPWMSADGLRVVTPNAPPRPPGPGKGAPKKGPPPSDKPVADKPEPPPASPPK